MSSIIAIIDLAGAICFLVTAWIGYWNYQNSIGLSKFWLVFTVAAVVGAVWAGSIAAEWFGFRPEILDQMHPALVVAAATAFSIAALATLSSEIKSTVS